MDPGSGFRLGDGRNNIGSSASVNEQTRFNLAEAISRLANIGRADPTIANHLGIKVSRRP